VIGARPQFVKAAAVSRALAAFGVEEKIIHTGQHYDENMSESFFTELEIPQPAFHLGVGSGNHGVQTGRMMQALEEVFLSEQPDWVLVFGDTNSTMAGALVAAKLHMPIAHVEAGLRSFDRSMPEEVNRVVTDHVSDVLFAPTTVAVENLQREGLGNRRIEVSGDVMFDVALFYAEKSERESQVISRLGVEPDSYVLSTIHRADNTETAERLSAVLGGLDEVAKEMPVVLPLHPRTAAAIKRFGLNFSNIRFIEPVGYLDMLSLLKHAAVIATDSGGVQKEAFFQGRPCVTLRNSTEWTELVDSGWNRLLPPESAEAVKQGVLSSVGIRGEELLLYGDGKASDKIARVLGEAK